MTTSHDTAAPHPDAPDMTTTAGRRKAWRQLMLKDHGFIRVIRKNRWKIGEDMWRMGQPSPADVAWLAARGVKTIVNLRGVNANSGEYLLEREACAAHGIVLEPFTAKSRDTPSKEMLRGARDLFGRIAYPAMMHCKSGSDRAGLMAVLYKHFRLGAPVAEAMDQLSLKYGHVRQGKTGMLDHFFEAYLAATDGGRAKAFMAWVEEDYDPAAVKADFMGSWWGNILTEKVLRRE